MCGGGDIEELGDVELRIVTESCISDVCGDKDRRIAVGITIPRLFGPTMAISNKFEFGAIFDLFSIQLFFSFHFFLIFALTFNHATECFMLFLYQFHCTIKLIIPIAL